MLGRSKALESGSLEHKAKTTGGTLSGVSVERERAGV
jgi:hypothetical protein